MAGQVGKRKLVVLEEGVLVSMANNSAFAKEFPFLAQLSRQRPGRGTCGGCQRAAKERVQLFSSVRSAIVGLASDKKRRLKALLNAEKVRLRYQGAKGRFFELTF